MPNIEFACYLWYSYAEAMLFVCFSVGLCGMLLGVCYALSDTKEIQLYLDKVSGYECGFDPFSDAREQFNIKFYLVSILFIIFDIELVFFFPWIVCQKYTTLLSFQWLYFFFFILCVGFIYEWQKKAIAWSDH